MQSKFFKSCILIIVFSWMLRYGYHDRGGAASNGMTHFICICIPFPPQCENIVVQATVLVWHVVTLGMSWANNSISWMISINGLFLCNMFWLFGDYCNILCSMQTKLSHSLRGSTTCVYAFTTAQWGPTSRMHKGLYTRNYTKML